MDLRACLEITRGAVRRGILAVAKAALAARSARIGAPRHPAFSPKTATLVVSKQALKGKLRQIKVTKGWRCCARPPRACHSGHRDHRVGNAEAPDGECGQPKLMNSDRAVEWEDIRLCSLMFAYVRLIGKKCCGCCARPLWGVQNRPIADFRFQISLCRLHGLRAAIGECKMHDRRMTAHQHPRKLRQLKAN